VYVLGVNSGWHDSSAALLKDGQVLAMVEQDRLSRKKHAMWETPTDAVAACLREAGITLDDVEVVAIGWDDPVCLEQKGERFDSEQYRQWLLPADRLPRDKTPTIQFVPHHLAHAASGLWTSGFDRAAILVMDGRGETQSTSLAAGSVAGIELLAEWDVSQSLGNFYGYAAEWAGFTFWGPGKLMGLAAYGRSNQPTPLITTDSGYRFDGSPPAPPDVGGQEQQHRDLLDRYFKSVYPFAPGDPTDVMAHAGFAASIQAALEEAIFQLARVAKERTDADDLVIAGGVGLNCTLNGRLARSRLFRDVYVPPVPHDTGVSLGAALVADRARCPEREPMPRFEHAYWGLSPAAAEVEAAIRDSGLAAVRLSEGELVARVADHLAEGRIVGWFQGRAEVGHLGEVLLDDLQITVLVAFSIGAKGPVRHAADVELLVADEEELAADVRTGTRSIGGRYGRAFEERGGDEPWVDSALGAGLTRELDWIDIEPPAAQILAQSSCRRMQVSSASTRLCDRHPNHRRHRSSRGYEPGTRSSMIPCVCRCRSGFPQEQTQALRRAVVLCESAPTTREPGVT
jgi:predicted NodU family carbamoyl transferase